MQLEGAGDSVGGKGGDVSIIHEPPAYQLDSDQGHGSFEYGAVSLSLQTLEEDTADKGPCGGSLAIALAFSLEGEFPLIGPGWASVRGFG